jgi:hypothetical protein
MRRGVAMLFGIPLADLSGRVCVKRVWQNRSAALVDFSIVVAIPACDEEGRIRRCLEAICSQDGMAYLDVAILVFVNGSQDRTFAEAVNFSESVTVPMAIVEADLPDARRDAGTARCVAVELAARMGSNDGLLFVTDADSVVPTGWIERYLRVFTEFRCDAIAGLSDMFQDDLGTLPQSLMDRGDWEGRYESCLDALEAWIDPLPHDPWPRHYQASGANLVLKMGLVREASDWVWPACGEDKALVEFLEDRDYRVRHDTSVRVLTSGRLFGRAKGGMAETMRHRIVEPESPCDIRLERLDRAYFRARSRRICRELYARQDDRRASISRFAARVQLSPQVVEDALALPHFGSAWRRIESSSERLARHALSPSQLPLQCARAESLLARFGLSFASVSQPIAMPAS